MSNITRITGLTLAAAAAGLFMTAGIGSASAAEEAKIQCEGVNACKGKSDCKTANSGCKGQNSCKGQGFNEMTQKDCDAAKAKMKKG